MRPGAQAVNAEDVLIQVKEVKRQLQLVEPDSVEYEQLFDDLVCLEAYRRSLLGEKGNDVIEVTPGMAAHWLSVNEVNRNLRVRVVAMYARDMAAGRWKVTGEAIKFSRSGKLLDGQHRLSAIVESGCTVAMSVIHDLDEDVQRVMDSGIRRSASDNIHMEGRKNAALAVATARVAISFERGDKNIGKTPLSDSEIYAWLESNPEVTEAIDIAVRYQKKVFGVPSAIAFSSFLIWKTVGNWYDVDEFWCAATEKVGLRHGDPVIALIDRFAQDRAKRVVVPRRAIVAAIVRAWNLRRQGKTMFKSVYVSRDGSLIDIPQVLA